MERILNIRYKNKVVDRQRVGNRKKKKKNSNFQPYETNPTRCSLFARRICLAVSNPSRQRHFEICTFSFFPFTFVLLRTPKNDFRMVGRRCSKDKTNLRNSFYFVHYTASYLTPTRSRKTLRFLPPVGIQLRKKNRWRRGNRRKSELDDILQHVPELGVCTPWLFRTSFPPKPIPILIYIRLSSPLAETIPKVINPRRIYTIFGALSSTGWTPIVIENIGSTLWKRANPFILVGRPFLSS